MDATRRARLNGYAVLTGFDKNICELLLMRDVTSDPPRVAPERPRRSSGPFSPLSVLPSPTPIGVFVVGNPMTR